MVDYGHIIFDKFNKYINQDRTVADIMVSLSAFTLDFSVVS